MRALRLGALRDTPDAFGATLEAEQDQPPEFWLARLSSSRAVTFLAVLDGEDVGIVTVAPFTGRPGAAGLFSMWVDRGARGKGIGDPLVEAVVAWSRSAGFERVLLEVGDDNAPAIRLYARNGFEPTGVAGTLPAPRAHIREHERALEL